MELRAQQIGLFVLASMALHLAVLTGWRARDLPPLPEPPKVLVFDLVAPSKEASAPSNQPLAPPTPAPVEAVAPPPKPAVEPLPEPAPKPLPEPVIEPAPMPKPLPEPVVEPAPKPVAKPKPAPKAPVRRPPEPVAKREPAPKVEPETQPRPEAAAPATPPAAPPSAATSQRVDAVVRARYEDLLHSWLERHKRYPLIARRRNMEGGVVVELLLGRDGSLQSHKLIEGSGYEILDEAAMALVASAAPYPKMPEDYPGESFRYRALIRYELR